MYYAGEPSVMARRLVDATYEAMWRGIRAVKPGATLGDVGHAIQQYAEGERFSVVREYCGHGIGKVYHDEPQVLHYGRPGEGLVLQQGMTFTLRSEEQTSELQSLMRNSYAVFCFKKNNTHQHKQY